MPQISMQACYDAYDKVIRDKNREMREKNTRRPAIQNYMRGSNKAERNGFTIMHKCRQALEALDRRGWQRSFHQRLFHDHFIRACVRIFWKREPDGAFARDHQSILEINGWDHLSQEVLVSTPRRSAWPDPVPLCVERVASGRSPVDRDGCVFPTDPDAESAALEQVPRLAELGLVKGWLSVCWLVGGGRAVTARKHGKVAMPKRDRDRRTRSYRWRPSVWLWGCLRFLVPVSESRA